MSWFSQLWQRATESARRAADDLARAAQTADAKTREAERVAIADAKKIVDNTIAAVREDEAMAAAESDIVVEATRREISQAKKAVGDGVASASKKTAALVEEAEEKTASEAKSIYRAARESFQKIKVGTVNIECGVANRLGRFLASPKRQWLQDLIAGAGRKSDQNAFDGKIITDRCQAVHPTSSGLPNGIRPDKCPRGKNIPKIVFVNGIDTKFQDGDGRPMCQSMRAIANAACSEVVGVYNATEGIGADLRESLQNIQKLGRSAPTNTLAVQILLAAESHQPLVIFAHSQGGLITQDALAKAKNDLLLDGMSMKQADEALSQVTVRSFGTAEEGWPVGPHYEHTNNAGDPVPGLIAGAQERYKEETSRDSDPTPTTMGPMPFANPVDPIANHNLSAYVPEMRTEPGHRECNCR